MFNLILHNIVYGLFECYLVLAFWTLRITFLDRLVEKLILFGAKKAKIKLVFDCEKEDKNFAKNGRDNNWPTFVVYDRRVFAKVAVYISLGLAEAFMVNTKLKFK